MNPSAVARSTALHAGIVVAVAVVSAGACATPHAGVKSQAELVHERACVQDLAHVDDKAALANCELCLEYDPRDADCLNETGLIWFDLRHDDAKAKTYFTKAVREVNDHMAARINLGRVALDEGDLDEAVRLFQSALAIDPHGTGARADLSIAYAQLGMRSSTRDHDDTAALAWFEKSEDQARKLVEVERALPAADGHLVDAYRELGVVLSWRAQIVGAQTSQRARDEAKALVDEAERSDRACVQVAPKDVGCRENLVHLLLATQRFDDAEAEARACLAVDENDKQCARDLEAAHARNAVNAQTDNAVNGQPTAPR